MVVLDRLGADDMQAHLAGEDEEQARRLGWWPKRSGRAQFRAMIEHDELNWSRGGPQLRLATRVVDELVGGCEIRMREPGVATIAYWTFPSHRRRGYAKRAARLLSEWAFEALELARIEAHVEEDNLASLAVALGAGFEMTGRRDDRGRTVLERRSGDASEGQSLSRDSPRRGTVPE